MRVILYLLLVSCVWYENGLVRACSNVGWSSYTSKTGDGTALTGAQYLMLESRFTVDCCGYVTAWSIFAHNTGSLSLQIWRSTGGSNYQLVGENVVSVDSTGDRTFTIDNAADQIPVESGDKVGWYTSGSAIVDWKNKGGDSDDEDNSGYLSTGAAATSVGDTSSFSSTTNERYAVYATVSSGSSPTFSNLPTTTVLSRQDVSSGTVFTAAATDAGASDTLTFSLQSASPSGAFALDSSTGAVSATSSSTSPGTYTLTIRVTDRCSNTATQALTITVTNAAPELHGLPVVADISESAVDETLIHLINVTDSDGDSVTCTVSSSPSGPFIEKYSNTAVVGQIAQGIYLQANPSLDYDVANTYTITVSCTDGVDTVTGTIYVYVVKNNVPIITNLQNTTSITSITPSNTAIFQVLYTDTEGDQTSFSLACVPSSPCPFSIFSTGQLFLSQSLLGTSISAYEVDVTVSDDFTSSGTHRLTVYVTDLNTTPVLANLPAIVQVTEDTAIGDQVFTVSVDDEDGETSHTFATSFSPAAGAGFFSIQTVNNSHYVTLMAKLDYVSQDKSYTMRMQASDGQATSAARSLVLEIVNVNEAPILYQAEYQVQAEEASAGTNLPSPGYTVDDPDGDNLTYAFVPGNSSTYGFSISETTGDISLTLNYDREDASLNDNSNRVWLISISDPAGLSVTATLTVSILDKNDNVPQLSATSYSGSVYSDASVGQIVTSASASDADVTAQNQVLEYSVSGTTLFNVDGSGNIVVFTGLGGYENTEHAFILSVKNPGSSSSDTAAASVYVHKATSEGFFDKAENIAWVTVVCLVGLGLLGGVAYLALQATGAAAAAPPAYSPKQVAPVDTKLPSTRPSSRSTVVTPSDIRAIDAQWNAWGNNSWF